MNINYLWARMETLYKAINIEIRHDPETNILHCRWIGLQDEDLIRISGEIILRHFKAKGCRKILNDNRDKIGPWYHSVEYTSNVWFPKMIKAGLTHFAWIFPSDIFAELSAKKAMPENSVVRIFRTFEEAHEWLALDASTP